MTVHDRFDLVVLDWAGTVVDFGCQAPVRALRDAFLRHGVNLSEAEARRDMGKAKVDHVRALLADDGVARSWLTVHGRAPDEAAIVAIMSDLSPLMREQASRAARLIDGARASIDWLRQQGVRIASSTGYTRDMMIPVLAEAAAQGYAPDHLVCSGETPAGRPTPLMIYKACAELGVWPLTRVVKVDDTETGVAEGRAAGCFTVGVAASGNGVGLTAEALAALDVDQRRSLIQASGRTLLAAGADVVIDTIADLRTALE